METVLKQILSENNIELNKVVNNAIAKLVDNAKISDLSKSISSIKNQIIEIFEMYRDKEEFKERHITIANANAKKEYNFIFDLKEFPNIIITEIKNIESLGLQFEAETNRIFGIPSVANTVDLQIVFYSKLDENQVTDIKIAPFIINADPKDLWLDKESDKGAKYPKNDDDSYVGTFLDKKLVIASKRGRSHAHEGLFRDDDFKVKRLIDGWEIIAVADGAGSAKYARQGSKIATESIAETFNNEEFLVELNRSVVAYYTEKEVVTEPITEVETQTTGEENLSDITSENNILKRKNTIINLLYKKVLQIHNELKNFASQEEIELKDLNTTLIFTLCKKFDFGYIVLSFGVGDCPINIISNDGQDVKLLNTLDVGEFGGGTRFITMPEIFSNPNMGSRFAINKFDIFDKLFLMTDGIYDPKFVTENKLEDFETWQAFLKDLGGENEDNAKVNFEDDSEIEKQLLRWMDFWSKGNHDDRTLAIIY